MYELPAAPAAKPAPAETARAATPVEALWSARIRELIAEYQNETPRTLPLRRAG